MNERTEAMQRCHPDSVKASRIAGCITNGILILIAVLYLILANWKDWTLIPGWIGLGIFICTFIWYTWVEPPISYRIFAYQVREDELEVHSGWIVRTETLVPMTRVQHVELERGPLLRKYNLAQVKVVTAATSHLIHALKLEEAQQLKEQIGHLAKVVEHDE